MMKKYFAALVCAGAILAAGCSVMAMGAVDHMVAIEQKETATIMPRDYPCLDDKGTIMDGNYPANVDMGSIKDEENGFSVDVTLFRVNDYHAGSIHEMKVGDTVFYNDRVITVNDIEHKVEGNNDVVLVNGGYEKDGITFVAGEGGSYVTKIDNDYPDYAKKAEGTILVDDKVVLHDKSNLEKPDGEDFTGSKAIREHIEKTNCSMNCYNTRMRFENGKLVEITVNYMP